MLLWPILLLVGAQGAQVFFPVLLIGFIVVVVLGPIAVALGWLVALVTKRSSLRSWLLFLLYFGVALVWYKWLYGQLEGLEPL